MGETLARRMARKRLPPEEALGVALDIARALRAAHAANIVHRDLKPANVYLHRGAEGEGDCVRVLDFGVSKILTPDETAFTVTGMLVGSPAYMSPEQAQASKQIDSRADLWSLGVLLFEMLTGRWPFQSTAPLSVISEILAGPLLTLASVLPGVDPRLDEAIRRCLERDVDQRMPSAAALIDVLRPILASMVAEGQGRLTAQTTGVVEPAPAKSFHSDEHPTTAINRGVLRQIDGRRGAPDDEEATSLLQIAAAQDVTFDTARTKPRQPGWTGEPAAPAPRPNDTVTQPHEPPWDLMETEKWSRSLAPAPEIAASHTLAEQPPPWARQRRPKLLLVLVAIALALVVLLVVLTARGTSP